MQYWIFLMTLNLSLVNLNAILFSKHLTRQTLGFIFGNLQSNTQHCLAIRCNTARAKLNTQRFSYINSKKHSNIFFFLIIAYKMTAIPFTCLSSSGTSSPSWTQTQRKAGHFLWLLLSISQYWHGWVSLMTVKEKPLMLKFHNMHRWCIYMQLNIHCYCWKPKIGVPSKSTGGQKGETDMKGANLSKDQFIF